MRGLFRGNYGLTPRLWILVVIEIFLFLHLPYQTLIKYFKFYILLF